MPTTYPTTLDAAYPTRAIGDTVVVADHNDLGDAIAALEAKLGIDSSAVTTSIDYKLKNTASVDPGHKHSGSGLLLPSEAQGDILYRNASGWTRLPASTAQMALITSGAGANPFWGPNAWTAYTPTITSGTGTLTSVSAAGTYWLMGKILFFHVLISITTNGTAATSIQLPLPASLTASGAQGILGFETAAGKALSGYVQTGGNSVNVYFYDGTYPGANNHFLIVDGVIEVV